MGGFARELLAWEWRPPLLTAEVSRARYFQRAEQCEVLAWCELRELGAARRCDIGSFGDVAAAKAACEADALQRLRREEESRPVAVQIARLRESSRKLAKPVQPKPAPAPRRAWGTSPEYELRRRRREAGDRPDLDAALAAFSGVIGDEG
jgi:hypothetical protein